MATLSELQRWRDALREARFSGTRSVEANGRKVEYRSDAELRQALSDVERMIAEAESRPPISTIRISASKGL